MCSSLWPLFCWPRICKAVACSDQKVIFEMRYMDMYKMQSAFIYFFDIALVGFLHHRTAFVSICIRMLLRF